MNNQKFLPLLGGCALTFCVFSVTPLVSMAQTEVGAPAAQAAGKETAMLRGWLLPRNSMEELKLLYVKDTTSSPTPIAVSANGARSISPEYLPVSEAGAVVELRAGDKTLTKVSLPLRRKRFYTLIATQSKGEWKLKVFSDGPETENALDRPLRVMNFADDCDIKLAFGKAKPLTVREGEMGEMRAPAKTAMLNMELLGKDGKSLGKAVLEIDVSAAGSAYVVVSPDYRGRMRPRIIYGGAISEETDKPAPVGGGQS